MGSGNGGLGFVFMYSVLFAFEIEESAALLGKEETGSPKFGISSEHRWWKYAEVY